MVFELCNPIMFSTSNTIRTAHRIFFLTGAGISAESGVPTFRDGEDGAVWRGMPFEALSSACMIHENLPLVWEWFDYRRGLIKDCKPNAAHLAITDAQRSDRWDEVTLVTQNIDGLHRAAGSRDLIELHGHINDARCMSCGLLVSLANLPEENRPPVCSECGDSMRPNVVLFGESLDDDNLTVAYEKASACDVCIVVGTSAVVYPANMIPQIAKRQSSFVIEINPHETELSSSVDVSIRGKAAEVLPELLDLGGGNDGRRLR